MIINAGIVEVIYDEEYSITEQTMAIFKEANVTVRRIENYSRPQFTH
jgi:deoxycytidylate deaminase